MVHGSETCSSPSAGPLSWGSLWALLLSLSSSEALFGGQGKTRGLSGRRAALRVWMGANNVSLRLVKLLAVFEPAVLRVIDSRMCGRSLTSIPVSSFYAGWRWMWIGDGVVTLIMGCGQLTIGLLHSHLEAESAGELNVVVSNLHGLKHIVMPDSSGSLVVAPHALRGSRYCLV